MQSPLVVGRRDAVSPAHGLATQRRAVDAARAAAATDVLGAPRASVRAGGVHGPRQHQAAPHWPAALGARVHVDGYGQGTYVRFDPSFLVSGHAHTIDFDQGGEQQGETYRGFRGLT
jgi:hypothetical protein